MIHAQLYMEREDAEENAFRFYGGDVIDNLFGDVQLDIHWGRLGQPRRTRSLIYENVVEAVCVLDALRFREEKRGYETLFCEKAGSPVVSLIPRRAYPFLDLKLHKVFNEDENLFRIAETMMMRGVVYTGSFVQLSKTDVMSAVSVKSHTKERVVTKTMPILDKVISRLDEFGLRLNASVPGWREPISMGSQLNRAVFLP